jgi:hypothetical protein
MRMAGPKGSSEVRLCLRAHSSRLDPSPRQSFAGRACGNEASDPAKSTLDRWLQAHEVKRVDVGYIVDEMVAGVTGTN